MHRKSKKKTKFLILTLTLTSASALAVAACGPEGGSGADGTAAETTLTAPDDSGRDAMDANLATMLTNIDDGYKTAAAVWQGFDPIEHPVVLAWTNDDDEVEGAVTINHPDPGAVGDATPVDTSGLTLGPVHFVKNLNPDAKKTLENLKVFEFDTRIGGVGSFLMLAGGTDSTFDPVAKDYVSTLLHEMFHRYQGTAFKGGLGSQDVEGYAYTAENIELAALEDRALIDAITADDEADMEAAAGRFAAVRLARHQADPRVVLDERQEMHEGSARYIEHRLAGDNQDYVYHDGNFETDLLSTIVGGDIKDYYGFSRFYGSGAAVLRILELMEVENLHSRIEGNETPAEILADELDVTDADVDKLLAEARAAYDPDGDLAKLATTAAKTAEDQDTIFSDPSLGDGTAADEDPGGEVEGKQISPEVNDCLVDSGVNFRGPTDENGTLIIAPEVIEKCFGDLGNGE